MAEFTVGSLDNIVRILEEMGEDPKREGLIETPERYLKALEFMTGGYKLNAVDIFKTFADGATGYDEMVVVKDIPFYSLCEHHLLPFFGVVHIAYIPDKQIVGLSKFARLVDLFGRRLQVQERLTTQIANTIEAYLSPVGVGVIVKARHMCMEARGVERPGTETVTSCMLGAFRDQIQTRQEFMGLVK